MAKNKLRTYLAVIEQQKKLVTWHDGDITAGDKARQEDILKEVADSDILLYLVSAASLASDNCNKELAEALKENLRIIPIILEACDWENHELSDFEVLPFKGKPINKWDPESDGWNNVVKGIREAVDKMSSQASPSPCITEEEIEMLADVALQRGNFAMMLEQMDAAEAAYSRAIELKPNYAAAYSNRGRAYRRKGEYDRAINDFNEAIALNPNYAEAYCGRGVGYHDKEHYETAIGDYTKAIQLKPDYVNAYLNRGVVYRDKRDYVHAIKDFTKVIDLEPNNNRAYSNRGRAYRRKGEYDRAINDFNEAIALNPNYAEAYCGRGVAYHDKEHYETAIGDHTKAIQLKPDYVNAYLNRGVSYRDKGDYVRAIIDFSAAIQLNPNLPGAYFNRGEARLHLGEWEKAKSDLMVAKDKGVDIIASFHNDYKSVEDFEQRNNVKLPEDIAAMLTPPAD